MNPGKTHDLVTGINCGPDTAHRDMQATKRRWDKRGGVLGYGRARKTVFTGSKKSMFCPSGTTPPPSPPPTLNGRTAATPFWT